MNILVWSLGLLDWVLNIVPSFAFPGAVKLIHTHDLMNIIINRAVRGAIHVSLLRIISVVWRSLIICRGRDSFRSFSHMAHE